LREGKGNIKKEGKKEREDDGAILPQYRQVQKFPSGEMKKRLGEEKEGVESQYRFYQNHLTRGGRKRKKREERKVQTRASINLYFL